MENPFEDPASEKPKRPPPTPPFKPKPLQTSLSGIVVKDYQIQGNGSAYEMLGNKTNTSTKFNDSTPSRIQNMFAEIENESDFGQEDNPFEDDSECGYSSSSSEVQSSVVGSPSKLNYSPSNPFLKREASELRSSPLGTSSGYTNGAPPLPPRNNSTHPSLNNLHIGPPPLPDRPNRPSQSFSDAIVSQKSLKDTYKTPDMNGTYRRPPVAGFLPVTEIVSKGSTRIIAFSRYSAVTGSSSIRTWYIPSGENRFTHPLEDNKPHCAAFVRTTDLQQDGKYVWVSLDKGEIVQLNVGTGEIVARSNVHIATVKIIIRGNRQMFTIDEGGGVKIWQVYEEDGMIDLTGRHRSFRISSNQKCAVLMKNIFLWTANSKNVEVYKLDDTVQNILQKKFDLPFGLGNITCISCLDIRNEVYTGHDDGKISVYDSETYELKYIIQISSYKILSILGVAESLVWVGFGTGKIIVFRLNDKNIWKGILSFQAYVSSGVTDLAVDDLSLLTLGNLTVMSVSDSGHMRFWNGLLTDYYQQISVNAACDEYSKYTPLSLLIFTYNIDSRKPVDMDACGSDRKILKSFLESQDADIYVFGFQELVDLENKSVSAKNFFKGTKKSHTKMDSKLAQRLRLWQDRLLSWLPPTYTVHKTSQLVGLFQCIITRNTFVVKDLAVSFVKTGLGGYHGNKGAIATRLLIGDSSLCFVNSHLAAHQQKVSSRNNDIQQIFKEATFPKIKTGYQWEKGGDGSCIVDHEYIFWSGDLNYRIDLTRGQVIELANEKNYLMLWKHDQLLKQKALNPSFGLRRFSEAPLQFPPTFKYDRGSSNFDTSEKQRVPAYCDRILSKGKRITQHSYGRLDMHMSDHRPVYASFTVMLKRVDETQYQILEKAAIEKLAAEKQQSIRNASLKWLMDAYHYNYDKAQNMLDMNNGSVFGIKYG